MARMEVVAKEVLPPGFIIEWTELSHQQEQHGIPTIAIFAASALFVFLVLAAQYESWKLPLAIVLILPMCLLASAAGLDFRGMPIDILAQIGFVVLVGLAAKNAILIVEFARQRQEHDGDEPEEAATAAARIRLRPILMTSFAFILGVFPLAVASGAGRTHRLTQVRRTTQQGLLSAALAVREGRDVKTVLSANTFNNRTTWNGVGFRLLDAPATNTNGARD
jgi:multidrug efflux pump subunit AcrB